MVSLFKVIIKLQGYDNHAPFVIQLQRKSPSISCKSSGISIVIPHSELLSCDETLRVSCALLTGIGQLPTPAYGIGY